MKILSLGKVPVTFGVKGDPNRAKAAVGIFPSAISLAPAEQWFPRVNEWPEGTVEMALAIAWFPGEAIGGYDDGVLARLAKEGIGEERLTFLPELVSAVFPRCDELWEKCQRGECPRWIHAAHPASYWRVSDGNLCVPYSDLRPEYRELVADWVGDGFGGFSGFLVRE